jgi:hypothetical protein
VRRRPGEERRRARRGQTREILIQGSRRGGSGLQNWEGLMEKESHLQRQEWLVEEALALIKYKWRFVTSIRQAHK